MVSVRAIPLTYNTVYLAECAGQPVLIDTGPDYDGARALLAAELGDEAPVLVVATHGHSDHAGLGRWWQSRGAPVAIGRDDARLIRAPHFSQPGEFEAFTAYVEASGAPPDIQHGIIRGLQARRTWVEQAASLDGYPPARPSDRWPSGLRFEPFEPDVLLDDNAELAPGLSALISPGHTPGNLVVASSDGALFSGDQLLPDITPTPGVQFVPGGDSRWERFPSLPTFVASLERLRDLSFATCYPGHGEPFDNVSEVIAQNLAQVEQRTERVLTELSAVGEATLHSLSEQLYPRALRRRWWQIVATVQGHLDLLAERTLAVHDEGRWSVARR